MNDAIAFKTRMTGMTTVPIDAQHLARLDEALTHKMRAAPKDFFKAAPFIVDLQEATGLGLADLTFIKNTFAKHGLLLIGLTNHSLDPDLLTQAGLANIANHHDAALHIEQPSLESNQSTDEGVNNASATFARTHRQSNLRLGNEEASTSSVLENLSAKTKIVKRHIRSGQRLYAPEGDLVIIGIVGAGAEIIADGNIFILGSLRGRAFAGAKGNASAFIYAMELSAELVSIAGNYQTMEQLDAYKHSSNSLITLSEDETMQIKAL